LQTIQQASEETLRCISFAAFLNEDVERNTILVHGAPKKKWLHTLDPDEYLVHVPLVPRPRPSVVQAVGKALAEFLAPAPHRLIGHDNTTFSQEQLDIAQRRLRLNTWYNQTAWLMISAAKRCQ
jgi:hypothetical protein